MSERPILLLYNIDAKRRIKLLPAAARFGILCRNVEKCEYSLPVETLAGIVPQKSGEEPAEVFTDPMFVMVNFSGATLNAFLNALRAAKMVPVALKAVLTPTNAAWDSVKLHDELLAEHRAFEEKKKHNA